MAVDPFKPEYQHVCSPHCSPYMYYSINLGEFDNTSRHFIFGDYLPFPNQLYNSSHADIVRRN